MGRSLLATALALLLTVLTIVLFESWDRHHRLGPPLSEAAREYVRPWAC